MANTFTLSTQGLIFFFSAILILFSSIIIYGKFFSKWIKSFDFNIVFYLLGIAVSLGSSIMLISWETESQGKYTLTDILYEEDIMIIPATVHEKPKIKPPPPSIKKKALPQKIKEIILIDEEPTTPQDTKVIDQDSYTPPPAPSYAQEAPVPAPKPIIVEEPTFVLIAQEMPRFPGCEEDHYTKKEKETCSKDLLLEYIYKHLKYPTIARQTGIEGVAVLQFVINKEGQVTDIKIRRDPGGGCGAAAAKLVKDMQELEPWIPGIHGGRKVNVLYTLPVKFKLK